MSLRNLLKEQIEDKNHKILKPQIITPTKNCHHTKEMACILLYYYNYTISEISALLEIHRNTATKYIKKTYKKFKKLKKAKNVQDFIG